MQVEIVRLSQYPKTIATFNAFLTSEKNKICMRINNIQGAGHNTFDYSQLTDTLKENWRIKIVKVINEICISKKIELIGELPKKYFSSTSSSRYEKTVMQYLKTYLLGGIKPENIDATKVMDNEKKNPFELRIKIEKLIMDREKNLLKTKRNQEKHMIRNLRKQKNEIHQKPLQKRL
jgi:putative cell wall-binding protein